MTKQEVLNSLRSFSKHLPKEAFKEIQANKEDYIPELLESLEYVRQNADELYDERAKIFEEAEKISESEGEYFLHTYAMYLLAEFREKKAFPYLTAWLALPEKQVDFIIGGTLTEDFDRILLCTFDAGRLQLLLDIIENQDLFEWARSAALRAYTMLYTEGHVSREDYVSYLRGLIYEKLADEKSYIVNTGIVGCIMDAKIYEMIPDARFMHENDKVDEGMHGAFDGFIDWIFYEKRHEKNRYIDNALAEIDYWACFDEDEDGAEDKEDKENEKYKKGSLADDLEELFGDEIKKDREIEKAFAQKQAAAQNAPPAKKPGRNDPCPCGSGKKYKKCCIDAANVTAPVSAAETPKAAPVEEKYNLLERYPNSPAFKELYEEEAINIDMLVYKALRHRSIPIWTKRDLERERFGKIDYLNEALTLFLDKCKREQITSFAAYDEKYMVHYRSDEWVAALVNFTKDDKLPKIKDIRKKASDAFEKFESVTV